MMFSFKIKDYMKKYKNHTPATFVFGIPGTEIFAGDFFPSATK
jgi:hypothetical protein